MQALLVFSFPDVSRSIVLHAFLPFPEKRPYTCANFWFMCTASMPPEGVLRSLKFPVGKDFGLVDLCEARMAGLRPFRETSVVRVEKDTLIEIGSSARQSIYKSGFIRDEPITVTGGHGNAKEQSALAFMLGYKAGTILCGNAGMPNTHASRYYILLDDIVDEKDKINFQSFMPLGLVTSGLKELKAACTKVAVHPRTFAPLKKISLTASEVEYKCSTPCSEELKGSQKVPRNPSSANRSKNSCPRVSGKLRSREENLHAEEHFSDGNNKGPNRTGLDIEACFLPSGEFFPTRNEYFTSEGSLSEPNIKRHRAELKGFSHDDASAFEPIIGDKRISSNKASEFHEAFDFFNAQEQMFLSDIENIDKLQRNRQITRARRLGKDSVVVSLANANVGQCGRKIKSLKRRY